MPAEPRVPAAPEAVTLPAATQPPPPAAAPGSSGRPYRLTAFQADGQYAAPGTAGAYPIQLEPPGLERLAQSMQTDASLQERIRQENRERKPMERVTFPESPVLSTDVYNGRAWEPRKCAVAPNYVVYGRLLFEQKNFERYGWDLGIASPLLSASDFLFDFVTLPYHIGTDPCRCFETNAGYCLPGDPVPLLLYPPELSLTGAALEVGTILTLVAIFP